MRKKVKKWWRGWKWARKLTGGAGASSDPNEINSGKQEGRQVRHCISPRHLHVTLVNSLPLLPTCTTSLTLQPGNVIQIPRRSYANEYQQFLYDLHIFKFTCEFSLELRYFFLVGVTEEYYGVHLWDNIPFTCTHSPSSFRKTKCLEASVLFSIRLLI